MAVTELDERTWRLESQMGERNVFQYLLASPDDAELLLVDTGTTSTPREVIAPALRRLGLSPDHLRLIVVTHPDLDHQGGLAALREIAPRALATCGFADRAMVADPECLVHDRYQAYLHEHGLGFDADELRSMRADYGAPTPIDLTLSGGEELAVGSRRLEVLHAPGHSAGHLVLFERQTGMLFSSDAVHWRMCPAADGAPALCPTYEEVDAYLGTIDLLESLDPSAVHSGHWPVREGRAAIREFLDESREFVHDVDAVLAERLAEPATLAQLCDAVQGRKGPWDSDARMLMFVVHGHVRRLLRWGRLELVDATALPRRFRARERSEAAIAHAISWGAGEEDRGHREQLRS
jgi:glyoxylase-like metal-dependent hydrolase (beta-lactamase superfamily II)